MNIICRNALCANHILVMIFYQEQINLVTFWFGGISKGFCGAMPAQLENTLIYIIHRSIHDTRTAQGTYDACWWGSPHIHLQSFVHRQFTHVVKSQIHVPEGIHVYRKSLTTSHAASCRGLTVLICKTPELAVSERLVLNHIDTNLNTNAVYIHTQLFTHIHVHVRL